jgi:GNAT superfamily N-acetyltransferase
MTVRPIKPEEFAELLKLYRVLHPEDMVVRPDDPAARTLWSEVCSDPALRYYVVEVAERLVATCTLTVIPNFTRGLKPYGVIENVVTEPACRRRGYATAVLRFALNEAWSRSCYKVMLETGSKEESTLRFYEKAGFRRDVKTGFIAYPNENDSQGTGREK